MTKQLFHLILFLLVYVSIPSTATAQTVAIPDPNLRAAVETALGKASGVPITAVEMATLTRLEARKSGIQILTGLEYATKLIVLDLGGNSISDISPVAGLTNLTELWLWGNNISDISVVAGLTELQRLHLGGNNISDILPMIDLANLTQLWLWGNDISNISVVVILTRLQWLHLGGNNISDISPVAGLTDLTGLNLGGNNISDISPVAGLTHLTWLGLNNNNISDILAVVGLANLRQLWLVDNSISDLSPLVANPGLGAGDIVDVTQNPLNNVSIHTHVPTLQSRGVTVGVNELTSGDIPDRNLRAVIETALGKAPGAPITVGEMATLTRLMAGNSNIHTLTGLELATNLTVLDLGSNSISDISPVTDLTNLTWLGLNNNNISDISAVVGLANLRQLWLVDNSISDLSPLVANPGLRAGDIVDVTQNPLNSASIYTHILALHSRGVTVQFDVPKPTPSAPATVATSEGGLTAQKVTEHPPPVIDETLQRGSESKMALQTEPILVMDEPLADIGQSLVEIAQRVSRQSTNQMVDLVFIVNWKMLVKKLDKRVEKFQRWIADMASVFDESMIDYRVTFIYFQAEASEVRGKPLEKGLVTIDRGWSQFSEKFLRFRGIVAREGLDAIMTGLTELEFSWEAERPFEDNEKIFIVMTNEALKTDWGTGRENELVEKIVDRCKQDEVQINVLGIEEEVQTRLTNLTGGEWYQIEHIPLAEHGALAKHKDLGNMSMPFLPKIDMIFERIAQHITGTVTQPVDIVFIFESSLSMDDKVDEICTGLDTLVKVLDGEGLDSRFGIIRFWAAGGSRSSVVTTRPPLNAEQVKKLFRRPKQRGDAHLLDAIMEGVPKLQTPDDRKLVLIIVTDKLPSSGPGTGYTYIEAIEVIRRAGAQTNIIGAAVPLGPKSGVLVDADEFQRRITVVTNGKYYIIPGAM